MHEGEWSSRLGIPGQPAEAEELMVMRDLALARLTGSAVHFLHLSTAGSLAMIRGAKASGLAVTAEVAPHHFTLTDAEVASYDPVFKVNPPLRSAADVAAVKAALADGVVDAIATDHAPHTQESQGGALRPGPARDARSGDGAGPGPDRTGSAGAADPGSAVVAAGRHRRPSADHGGPIAVGRPANLCVIDTGRQVGGRPRRPWPAGAATPPTPGRALVGRNRHTVLRGEPVVIDGEAQR